MSHRKISKALAVHLSGMGVPTAYENAKFEPTADDIYLQENYLPTSTNEIGLENTSTDNFSGIYQVMVNAPRGKYKFDGYTQAEAVVAHFARGTTVTAESLQVRVQRVQQSPAIEQGDRWVIPVSIEFIALVK